PAERRHGIGRRLIAAAIAKAERIGATRLYLETNHTLTGAIALYESMGFRHLPPSRVKPSHYTRADVYMERMVASAPAETSKIVGHLTSNTPNGDPSDAYPC
ncbi:MAG TPA: GNAT family N-acetyltransferase, partial [Acidobacteriaceae bacterium]